MFHSWILRKLTSTVCPKLGRFLIFLCWTTKWYICACVICFVTFWLVGNFGFCSTAKVVGNKAKRRIWKQVFQKNKARQIFRKTNIFYPQIRTRTCAHQGVRNVRFSEHLTCFVFLKHPFWDPHFHLICWILEVRYGEDPRPSFF